MKKVFIFLFLALTFLFTSCFETVETLSINSDGAGSIQLKLNMSKSKAKINSLRRSKTVNGHKIPTESDVKKKMNELKTAMHKINGISNVKTGHNFSNYIFTFSCDFKNVSNLNSVLNTLKNEKLLSANASLNYRFSFKNKKLSRTISTSVKSSYNKLSAADKKVFNSAKHTSIIKFTSSIKSKTNSNFILSSSKKAVMFKSSYMDIIHQNKNLNTTITLN